MAYEEIMGLNHQDKEVQQAIVRLCDVLCTYERNTGIESVLIIREQGGFCFRAVSGKPGIPDDILDEEIISLTIFRGENIRR